jgi:hypothetical protein
VKDAKGGKWIFMNLFHYYERARGPLLNLSDLELPKAQAILDEIRAENEVFAAHRYPGYLDVRRRLEGELRALFIEQGGKPRRAAPHTFTVEACPWVGSWYKDAATLVIPLEALDLRAISFCYGDMFPTFSPRVTDGREYRRRLYDYEGILALISRYGLPQNWNPNGEHGPERYIEAHVWQEIPLDFI